MSPLDLHVLGTPPAFVLSQDQTLPFNPSTSLDVSLFGIFASLSLMFARFFSVSFSRFASLHSRAFAWASLDRISNEKAFVKHFLALFSEKYKADQRFRTMRRLALQMFGFWTFPQTVFRRSFGFYRRSVLRFVDLVNQFLEESLTRRESSPVPTELCPF